MRGRGRTVVIGLIVWIACIGAVHAQEAGLRWVEASGGAIPAGAVAYGHEADNREQFACRGPYEGGIHLGKIVSGFSGCNIGYGGLEVTLPAYEVLVQPRPRALAARTTPSRVAMTSDSAASISGVRRPPVPPSVPASPPDATTKRGFDENGEPYVEVRLPDGTIKRTQENGVTLIKPDGTTQYISHQVTTINAPPPTAPELPDAPNLSRAWVARHNEQLLDIIRTLVNRDDAQMKKFADAEQKTTHDDVFEQIAYRTKIATFLAQGR